jgi:membrane-associated phospholipid phosphatase
MVSWDYITNLGNINVLGPAALAIALWLVLGRAWRLAWCWCLMFGGGLALVVASKIAFIGWGVGSQAFDFTGFSGHAMRAMAVFPVMLFLILHRTSPATRVAGVVLGIAAGVLIGVSRVQVHAHSTSEVISGGLLGLLVSLSFLSMVGHRQKFSLNGALIALSLLGLFGTSYAAPAPTHSLMVRLTLLVSGHERPFVREGWHYDPYYRPEPPLWPFTAQRSQTRLASPSASTPHP